MAHASTSKMDAVSLPKTLVHITQHSFTSEKIGNFITCLKLVDIPTTRQLKSSSKNRFTRRWVHSDDGYADILTHKQPVFALHTHFKHQKYTSPNAMAGKSVYWWTIAVDNEIAAHKTYLFVTSPISSLSMERQTKYKPNDTEII
jgi:hypothetical protein